MDNDNEKKLFPPIICKCCKLQINHLFNKKKLIINPTPSSSK